MRLRQIEWTQSEEVADFDNHADALVEKSVLVPVKADKLLVVLELVRSALVRVVPRVVLVDDLAFGVEEAEVLGAALVLHGSHGRLKVELDVGGVAVVAVLRVEERGRHAVVQVEFDRGQFPLRLGEVD